MAKATIAPAQGLVELQLLAWNLRLRQARLEKGLNQKALSLITGIPVKVIQQIENLWLIPRREVMEELSSALEKPVDFLFPPELLEAIEAGVFHERKVQLEVERLISFTEAKRLGYWPALALTSGIEELERIDLKYQIKEVLKILRPRERKVIILRFGLEGGSGMTLEEIGQEELGVTRERVRQIELRAFWRLRRPAWRKKLEDFLD